MLACSNGALATEADEGGEELNYRGVTGKFSDVRKLRWLAESARTKAALSRTTAIRAREFAGYEHFSQHSYAE